MNHLTAEVAVVGAGPAGLTAAIALASAGVETVLIARSPTASDVRTSALLAGSVKALDTLGVWRLCREHAAPLSVDFAELFQCAWAFCHPNATRITLCAVRRTSFA